MNARRMAHLAWLVLGMLGLALGSGGCAQERDERALRADQIATQEGLARVAGEVLDDPDRLQRMERLSGLLELLPGDRYGELSALIESRAVIPRQEDIGLIMHAWARRDPKAAFAQGLDWKLREMPWTEPIPDHAVSEVIYAWSQDAGADVEAAIADVPQDLQPLLKVAMIRGWTESGQEMRATNAIANEQSGFGQLLVTRAPKPRSGGPRPFRRSSCARMPSRARPASSRASIRSARSSGRSRISGSRTPPA
jgi:hypothetical protein